VKEEKNCCMSFNENNVTDVGLGIVSEDAMLHSEDIDNYVMEILGSGSFGMVGFLNWLLSA